MHGETITLLLLIVLGFTTWQGLNRPGVMDAYMFSTDALRFRRQWFRLFTPAFLHGSWGHFAGNAITLFFFGRGLENALGPGILLGLFFGSVAGGHGLCWFLHRQGGDYRSIGASGGTLGLLFAAILLMPGMSIFIFPIPLPIPAWLYALGFLIYTLSSMGGGSGVSHEAHLGGMLSGILLTWMQFPQQVMKQPLLLTVILVISLVGLYSAHANPGRVPGFWKWRVRQWLYQRDQTRRQQAEDDVDALLDKVSRQGIQSLTARERERLQAASRKRGGRR